MRVFLIITMVLLFAGPVFATRIPLETHCQKNVDCDWFSIVKVDSGLATLEICKINQEDIPCLSLSREFMDYPSDVYMLLVGDEWYAADKSDVGAHSNQVRITRLCDGVEVFNETSGYGASVTFEKDMLVIETNHDRGEVLENFYWRGEVVRHEVIGSPLENEDYQDE